MTPLGEGTMKIVVDGVSRHLTDHNLKLRPEEWLMIAQRYGEDVNKVIEMVDALIFRGDRDAAYMVGCYLLDCLRAQPKDVNLIKLGTTLANALERNLK